MTPRTADIDAAVARAQASLVARFRAQPHTFFTEQDLTSHFAHQLHVQLEPLGLAEPLVHLEYPTPFRCDMSDSRFVARGEDDSTPRGRRYRRGHYDLVVMDPDFLRHCRDCRDDDSLRRGQDWERMRRYIADRPSGAPAPLLWVYELMFIRAPFGRAGRPGRRGEGTLAATVLAIHQDRDKARAATRPGFVGTAFARNAHMLVFDSCLDAPVATALRQRTHADVEIVSVPLPAEPPAASAVP